MNSSQCGLLGKVPLQTGRRWSIVLAHKFFRALSLALDTACLNALKPIHKNVEVAMIQRKQAGQVLVSAALMLVVVLGFVGLGIDMGVMRYEKRMQQTAADGAAIAAATNLPPFSGNQTAALNASAANGFTDNTAGGACVAPPTSLAVGSVTVTVCNGPSTGPHAGNVHYVEAYVSAGQPTYFMKIFGVASETVTARAVATNTSGGTNGTTTGCLYTLGPPSSSIEGVNINGNATLYAPTCGIVDNGNYNTQGNSLQVTAGSFGVSGSANVSGQGGHVDCTNGSSACPTYGAPAAGDPLSTLTPPCSPCTGGTAISINGNGGFTGTGVTYANNVYTVSPGTYSSISISGTGGGNSVVFSAGTYVINGAGGLTIPGNATISGSGVTFYFTGSATIGMTGTPTINLTAPSTGTYAGMLMWQDPADTNTTGPSLGGNSGSQFNGILYFPKDQLTFFGNNTSLSVGVVVADSLSLSGHPNVTFNGAAGVPGGLPPSFTVGTATLVE
jgi:Putative Flp pilus-assembly TadE/G-like